MTTQFKSVITLLVSIAVVTTAACASDPPAPTPNIEATFEAKIARLKSIEPSPPTPDIEATVEARVQATQQAKPTIEATVEAKVPEQTPAVGQPTEIATPTATADERETATRSAEFYGYLVPLMEATDYHSQARVAMSNSQPQMAIDALDKAIGIRPEDFSEDFYLRGSAYLELGQHQRAIQDYDKAIQLDPSFAAAYNNRRIAYSKLGEYTRTDSD